MKTLTKNKSTIVAIVLLVLVLYAYSMFKDSFISPHVAQENIGADIVELFASLEKVSLNQSLFSSPMYRPLNNFSPILVEQPTGRNNPFNVIGRD